MPAGAYSLQGRVALVTGAGDAHGIGFATARLLGELGAAVAVTATTDRVADRAAELRKAGVESIGVVGDLTKESQALDVVRLVREQLGAPLVLVNGAGMTSVSDPSSESGTALETSLERWRETLARNLDTAFLTTRAVLPGMLDARWGRIVMVSSVTGPAMAMKAEAGYAAAKAAMLGLARSIALDYADAGVTCNVVAPGWIRTASQTTDEAHQGRRTPVGRSGAASEVASAISFLCSPGASYVTGQCLLVDGGNAIAEERA